MASGEYPNSKLDEYDAVFESYANGQFTQMAQQINEFGVYDFTLYLDADEHHNGELKYKVLKLYLRVQNK